MQHAAVSRRGFLRIVGAAAGAASLPASLRQGALVTAGQDGVFPGARLQICLAKDAPSGCAVQLRARGMGAEARSLAVAAAPGTAAWAETPYPHTGLVAGEYTVDALLVGPDGAILASAAAGSYRVRPFRFSA